MISPNHRQPGYLLVGVDDDGTPNGLVVTDELLRRLADLRSNVNLEPLPAMTVEKYARPKGEVAVVEVMPSDLPPVRYKGRVWIRIEPSRRGANRQEERILTEKRTALQKTFDTRPCQGCSLDDLVLDLFLVTYLPYAVDRDVIRENNRRVKEQMASLRFYWYDDRIEIQNPGGLYGMASPENFPRQTDYRNPVIAEAMATLGYVNAFGRGVIRAQDALARNGTLRRNLRLNPRTFLPPFGGNHEDHRLLQ